MKRLTHDAPLATTISSALAFVAIPIMVYVVFTVWPDSLSRQIVASGSIMTLLFLAASRKKLESLLLAILFFSQFGVSLHSFNLNPPVKLSIHFNDLLLAILILVSIERQIRLRLDSVGWLFLLLIIWFAFTSFFSAHPHRSIVFLLWQFKFFILYILALSCPLPETLKKKIIYCVLGIIVIQGTLSITQVMLGSSIGLGILGEASSLGPGEDFLKKDIRCSGTISGSNAFAGYMAMLLTFLLPYILVRRSILYYSLYGVGFFSLILSLSRAGWLSFIIGSLLILFVMHRFKILHFIHVMLFVVTILVIITIGASFHFDKIKSRFVDREAISSATGRITQFYGAWEVIQKHPVVGIGPGITEFFGRWNNNRIYIKKALPGIDMPNQVHNSHLQVFIESGFPGLIIFTLITISIFIFLFRKAGKEPGDNLMMLLRIGGTGASIAVITHISFGTEFNNSHIFLVFWTLLGISRNKSVYNLKKF